MPILFTGAFIFSFIASLGIIYLAHRYDLFIDPVDPRKPQNFHTKTTPRAGGIAIFFGILPLASLSLGESLLLPTLLAFGSGIFEDFHRTLSPRFRLFLQIAAALSAVLLLNTVVTYLGLGITMPYWLGVIFSIVAITGMMNAVNIIDGFNGLASGVVLLILCSFGIVSWQHHNWELLDVILIIAGSVLGFFIVNFPRGRLFLGDGGAYMLGFLAAVLGIFLAARYETVSPWYVLAILIYPVWEVLFSIIRKNYMKCSPLKPDSNHLHMLIYRHITHNNPLTSLLMVVLLVPFLTLSTIFANKSNTNMAVAVTFIILYTLLYRYLYRKEVLQKN